MESIADRNHHTMSDTLFFISYGIYLAAGILSSTFYFQYYKGWLYNLILVGCLLLLLIREIEKDKIKFSLIPLLLLTCFLSLIMLKNGPNKYTFWLLIYIFCARDINFRKIARFTWILSSIVFLLIIVSSQLGIIRDYYDYWSGRTRHYLGFLYPLYPSTVMFNITALYICDKHKNISWFALMILAGINYFLYSLTDSRLCFITACIIILIAVVMKLCPTILNHMKIISFLMIASFPLGFMISYFGTVLYRPYGLMNRLNNILGGRLELGQRSIKEYGSSLFGQRIEWIGNGLSAEGTKSTAEYNFVDSLYLQVFLRYGLIFSIIAIVILTMVLVYFYQNKEFLLLALFSVLAVHAIIDNLIFYLHYNTFWLAIGSALCCIAEKRRGESTAFICHRNL